MGRDAPGAVSLNIFHRRRRNDAPLSVERGELPVERGDELLPVHILRVVFPGVFAVKYHRHEHVPLVFPGSPGEHCADKILRTLFPGVILVRKSDSVGKIRVAEDKRDRAAVSRRKPVRRCVRHAGGIGPREVFHVARTPCYPVVGEDMEDSLRECPLTRPHAVRWMTEHPPEERDRLCDMGLRIGGKRESFGE